MNVIGSRTSLASFEQISSSIQTDSLPITPGYSTASGDGENVRRCPMSFAFAAKGGFFPIFHFQILSMVLRSFSGH